MKQGQLGAAKVNRAAVVPHVAPHIAPEKPKGYFTSLFNEVGIFISSLFFINLVVYNLIPPPMGEGHSRIFGQLRCVARMGGFLFLF